MASACAARCPSCSRSVRGKLLWRFGVLLAGDDATHALLPTLPLAPAEEIAAVEG